MQRKKPRVALKHHLDELAKGLATREDFEKLNHDIARTEAKLDLLLASVHGQSTVDQYNQMWAEKMETDKTPATLVVIESPFAGEDDLAIARNIRYAKACVMDCLKRGESPYASHLFFTLEGLLDDTIPEERKMGIHAGFLWGQRAHRTVVYTDLGTSGGMEAGIREAHKRGRPVEYRSLEGWNLFTSNQELDELRKHRRMMQKNIDAFGDKEENDDLPSQEQA